MRVQARHGLDKVNIHSVRTIEAEILQPARSWGSAYVPYSPLGRGYLTARLTRTRLRQQPIFAARISRALHRRRSRANRVVIKLLEKIGAQKGATPAQIALAWLLGAKTLDRAIPGSPQA